MVTFDANWCMDCRNLHHTLKSNEVHAYTSRLFDFVKVNIGKFNENLDVAAELGVIQPTDNSWPQT
jgi:protein disulfide-isomerase